MKCSIISHIDWDNNVTAKYFRVVSPLQSVNRFKEKLINLIDSLPKSRLAASKKQMTSVPLTQETVPRLLTIVYTSKLTEMGGKNKKIPDIG